MVSLVGAGAASAGAASPRASTIAITGEKVSPRRMGRIVPPVSLSRVEDMDRSLIMIVGAGPGVSGSVARRFAREGYDVALVGIDEDQLTTLAEELGALGVDVGHAVA